MPPSRLLGMGGFAPRNTPIDNEAKQLFWEGKTDDPAYRKTTDWGDLGAFFFPRRYEDRKAPKHQLDSGRLRAEQPMVSLDDRSPARDYLSRATARGGWRKDRRLRTLDGR